MIFILTLIICSLIDLKYRIIPEQITIGGMIIGLIINWEFALIGILVGSGLVYLSNFIGDFLLKKKKLGGGDLKFLAMIGAILGWKSALLTFFIAPIFGISMSLILKNKKSIPYCPCLSLAALISMRFV